MKKIALIIIFLCSLHLALAGGTEKPNLPITIKVEVDKHYVSIGEKIRYSIIAAIGKDFEIEFPDFTKGIGNFNVRDSGARKSEFFGNRKITQWYILDTYVTGKSVIPKAKIKYKSKQEKDWSETETSEAVIEIKSLLEKAGSGARLRDIKGPIGLRSGINFFLVLIALSVILILGLIIVFLRKNKKREKVLRLRPAHEIAYEQLNELKKKNFLKKGMIKEYYAEISAIIRHYLENRFNLKAPEMTTEEFLAHVRDYSQLAAIHKALLKEFLLNCDLVKFAKYIPPEWEFELVFDSAKNFVDQTKQDLEDNQK